MYGNVNYNFYFENNLTCFLLHFLIKYHNFKKSTGSNAHFNEQILDSKKSLMHFIFQIYINIYIERECVF